MPCDARNDMVSFSKDICDLNREVRERHPNCPKMRAHYFGAAATFCSIVIHVIGGNEAVQI